MCSCPSPDQWAVLRCSPGGADHAGQQRSLLLQGELHDAGRLELLPDPLALLQVVDEHELHADVLTVRHLRGGRGGGRGREQTESDRPHRRRSEPLSGLGVTSRRRMISFSGRTLSEPPMKVVVGSRNTLSRSDSSKP